MLRLRLNSRSLRYVTGVILTSGATFCFASGAFNPSAPGPVNAQFTLGKSIVTGRKGSANCAACHTEENKFKRNTLQQLGKLVSEVITDCTRHKPCFAQGQDISLSSDELAGLDGYFIRRYRLR